MLSINKSKIGVIKYQYGTWYTFILALLPIIKIIKVPFTDFGLGILFLLISLPWILCIGVHHLSECISRNPFIWMYFLYLLIRNSNNSSDIILIIAVGIHLLFIPWTVDYKILKKTVVNISIIASFLLIIQRILSVLGINISLLYQPILLSEYQDAASVYIQESITRVSGIFLEPSHFAQYTTVAMLMLLIDDDKDYMKNVKISIFISVAILASTSGIGVLSCFGAWAYYYIVSRHGKSVNSLVVGIIGFVIGFFALYVVLSQFEGFNLIIQRIFGEVDGYNAVSGRNFATDIYLSQLNSGSYLFGMGNITMEYYAVSWVEIMYKYGIVGLLLLGLMLIYYFKNNKAFQRVLVILYVAFLLGTSNVGYLNYTFYLGLMNVCREDNLQ